MDTVPSPWSRVLILHKCCGHLSMVSFLLVEKCGRRNIKSSAVSAGARSCTSPVVVGAGGQGLDLSYSFYILIYSESFGKFDFRGKNTRERTATSFLFKWFLTWAMESFFCMSSGKWFTFWKHKSEMKRYPTGRSRGGVCFLHAHNIPSYDNNGMLTQVFACWILCIGPTVLHLKCSNQPYCTHTKSVLNEKVKNRNNSLGLQGQRVTFVRRVQQNGR